MFHKIKGAFKGNQLGYEKLEDNDGPSEMDFKDNDDPNTMLAKTVYLATKIYIDHKKNPMFQLYPTLEHMSKIGKVDGYTHLDCFKAIVTTLYQEISGEIAKVFEEQEEDLAKVYVGVIGLIMRNELKRTDPRRHLVSIYYRVLGLHTLKSYEFCQLVLKYYVISGMSPRQKKKKNRSVQP